MFRFGGCEAPGQGGSGSPRCIRLGLESPGAHQVGGSSVKRTMRWGVQSSAE